MSQKSDIRRALCKGRRISPLSALREFGCMRLSARIMELREEGYAIETEMHDDGYAIYYIPRPTTQGALFGGAKHAADAAAARRQS